MHSSAQTTASGNEAEAKGRRGPASRWWRAMIVLLGLWGVQAVLYWPSLVGLKVLLPLDLLAAPRTYLPVAADGPWLKGRDRVRSDLVLGFEPERRFAAAELAAGRLATWLPYQFGGVPARVTLLSPLHLLRSCTASPVIHAWMQLLIATVAGFGAYRFARSVAGVGFWSAAIMAWCYPLTGAEVCWQGFPPSEVIGWFPWMLVAVDRAVHEFSPGRVGGVALTTVLVLLVGQIDVAALALLGAGVFGLWRMGEIGLATRCWGPVRSAVAALVLGWCAGFMVAAPGLLPALEYATTGGRMIDRAGGREERPPVGLESLPLCVLPDLMGTTKAGSLLISSSVSNQMESAAAAYAGAVATLLLAPLAWNSRRHRSFLALCVVLAGLGLGWAVDLPGWVQLCRAPGLNMLSFNRFVFLSGFAFLAMAVVGLDTLGREGFVWRNWFLVPVLLSAGLAGWCFFRSSALPEPVATQLSVALERGANIPSVRTPQDVAEVQDWFRLNYTQGGALCVLVLVGWLLLAWRPARARAWAGILGTVMVLELFVFAYDRSEQCAPSLYYPPIPALVQAARAEPGRVISVFCNPANLAMVNGLDDVRGYDGVDPKAYTEVVNLAAEPGQRRAGYSALQYFTPRFSVDENGAIRLPPALDLLGVRYVVFRGPPQAGWKPDYVSPDYHVMTNRRALPRVFVPRRVEVVAGAAERLRRMAAPDFDPRAVVFAEHELALPADCRGGAAIVASHPTRISVAVKMETAGMLVMGDRWDDGWVAYLAGRRVPVLRVDHALRGVVVAEGESLLEFRYEPASIRLGLIACGIALGGGGLWGAWALRRRRAPLD